jgi:hypothetical protein
MAGSARHSEAELGFEVLAPELMDGILPKEPKFGPLPIRRSSSRAIREIGGRRQEER